VRKYVVNGIDLWIPSHAVTKKLHEALTFERYESSEAKAVKRHILPSDRMLDLGSGAGYLAALAAKVIGGEAVLGLEAGEAMAGVAQQNLDRNVGTGGKILWGAVVPDTFSGDSVTLNVGRAFWASSLADIDYLQDAKRIDVPAKRIGALVESHRPTVISMDVEGGELALFDSPLPDFVRLVILEIHPAIYGAKGVKRVFDGLSASELAYCPQGSRGSTVVFERVAEAPSGYCT
jgi:FkbM family methyltransferase